MVSGRATVAAGGLTAVRFSSDTNARSRSGEIEGRTTLRGRRSSRSGARQSFDVTTGRRLVDGGDRETPAEK